MGWEQGTGSVCTREAVARAVVQVGRARGGWGREAGSGRGRGTRVHFHTGLGRSLLFHQLPETGFGETRLMRVPLPTAHPEPGV